MQVPARTPHNWHYICCPSTAGKISWTTSRLIHGLRWSDKGIWYSQPRPSLEHSAQIWLPSHFYCHTITISNRHVCSCCHGWFSVFQLSCWSGTGTRLRSSPSHLQPVSSRYDLYLTVTSNYLIVLELSVVLMVVSSNCGVSRPMRSLLLQWFLPFSTPMMQPFPALLLTHFNVVLMSCLKLTYVLAL